MKCARLIHNSVISHRPYSDYEGLVTTNVLSGTDYGELNHSEWFARQFTIQIANQVRDRLHKYFNTIQEQTGFKPSVTVIADKDTTKHRTRQIILFLIVVPDSENLIQTIYIAHPVVKRHTGPEIAKSITDVTDEWITADQFVCGAFDGQYINLGVPASLNEHYELVEGDAYYTWDPLHLAGIQDKHT